MLKIKKFVLVLKYNIELKLFFEAVEFASRAIDDDLVIGRETIVGFVGGVHDFVF